MERAEVGVDLGEFEIFIIGLFAFFENERRCELKPERLDKKNETANTTIAVGEGVDLFKFGVGGGEVLDGGESRMVELVD